MKFILDTEEVPSSRICNVRVLKIGGQVCFVPHDTFEVEPSVTNVETADDGFMGVNKLGSFRPSTWLSRKTSVIERSGPHATLFANDAFPCFNQAFVVQIRIIAKLCAFENEAQSMAVCNSILSLGSLYTSCSNTVFLFPGLGIAVTPCCKKQVRPTAHLAYLGWQLKHDCSPCSILSSKIKRDRLCTRQRTRSPEIRLSHRYGY